jgi:hypothetical protein
MLRLMPRSESWRRSKAVGVLPLVAALVIGLVAAAPARATDQIYWDGPFSGAAGVGTYSYSPLLLTQNAVRKLGATNGIRVCELTETTSYVVDSTPVCVTAQNDIALHGTPFCGCTWRYGVAYLDNGGSTSLRARASY